MSYYNDTLTFAMLADMPHKDMISYFGKLSSKVEPEVKLSGSFASEDTSIDLID